MENNQPYTLYIGTYTEPPHVEESRKEGVYQVKMDPTTGHLEIVRAIQAGPNPSFIALHPNGKFVYVANELPEGSVSSLAMDPKSGDLHIINSQPAQGADPCYVSLDPKSRWLMTACYSSGNLSVYPIQSDGQIGPLSHRVQHEGHGPNEKRQEKAHAHSIRFDPTGHFVFAADLGIDRVWAYHLDPEKGQLTPNTPAGYDGLPGAGPRHLEFHSNHSIVYISNELNSTVTVCRWNGNDGTFNPVQSISTLPEGFSGDNIVADIHRTPSGEFLYVSNRGHDSIAAFRMDAVDGTLTWVGCYSCGGGWPRNFAIDPQGRYLLAANEFTNNVVVFAIAADGSLKPTGEELQIPVPVCVVFA